VENIADKKLLNCPTTDPNQILPIKYHWSRVHYKNGVANSWTPEEVNMQKDVEMWRSPDALTRQERRLVLRNMGFFSTAESLTANNIVLTIYRHITSPECRQYLLRQAYEEAVHTDTFIYCCDTLGLDPSEVYSMYREIPSIKDKDDFVLEITRSILDPAFTTEGTANVRRFVHDTVGYYVVMEGIFFYAGFVMMLSFLRQNKMVGVGEQFQFILRDESVHLAFGTDLINTIVRENPEIWTEEFKRTITGHIARGGPRARLRERLPPQRHSRPKRRLRASVRPIHRGPAVVAHQPARVVSRRQPVTLDERSDGPPQGEELLRDAGHRIPVGRDAPLG